MIPAASLPTREIERIESPSREVFEREYIARRRPVIVTGIANRWKAFTDWTPDYLKAKAGEERISVDVSRTGFFKPDEDKGMAGMVSRDMSFGEYIDWIEAGDRTEQYYLAQQSIRQKFKILLEDIEIPELFDPQFLREVNMWVGAGGNVSPLHCDYENNLLVQVQGRKRLILFPHRDHAHLYPYPLRSKMPLHLSRVDIEKPDYERFPKFRQATPYRCELQSGEMLYIPLFWWHQVYGFERNIAVNIWWKPSLPHLLTPPAYMLRSVGKLAVSTLRAGG